MAAILNAWMMNINKQEWLLNMQTRFWWENWSSIKIRSLKRKYIDGWIMWYSVYRNKSLWQKHKLESFDSTRYLLNMHILCICSILLLLSCPIKQRMCDNDMFPQRVILSGKKSFFMLAKPSQTFPILILPPFQITSCIPIEIHSLINVLSV